MHILPSILTIHQYCHCFYTEKQQSYCHNLQHKGVSPFFPFLPSLKTNNQKSKTKPIFPLSCQNRSMQEQLLSLDRPSMESTTSQHNHRFYIMQPKHSKLEFGATCSMTIEHSCTQAAQRVIPPPLQAKLLLSHCIYAHLFMHLQL